jgi:hypothetical protein
MDSFLVCVQVLGQTSILIRNLDSCCVHSKPKKHSYELFLILLTKKEANFFYAKILVNCSLQPYGGSRKRWRATQLPDHRPHPTAMM